MGSFNDNCVLCKTRAAALCVPCDPSGDRKGRAAPPRRQGTLFWPLRPFTPAMPACRSAQIRDRAMDGALYLCAQCHAENDRCCCIEWTCARFPAKMTVDPCRANEGAFMRRACEQCDGNNPQLRPVSTKRLSVQVLVLGFFSTIAGCDLSSFHKEILAKYSHPDVYICSPSGFGQQSSCTLKV